MFCSGCPRLYPRGESLIPGLRRSCERKFRLIVTPSCPVLGPRGCLEPVAKTAYGAGFSKQETRSLANVGGVTGFCALLSGPLAIVCGIAGAPVVPQAGLAANANACVFIAAVPAPLAVRWFSSKCR